MIQSFCDWLAGTSISQLFADVGWFVPTVQTVHILAIAAVVTLLSVLNFRLLGLTREGPGLQNLAQGFLPWVWRAVSSAPGQRHPSHHYRAYPRAHECCLPYQDALGGDPRNHRLLSRCS